MPHRSSRAWNFCSTIRNFLYLTLGGSYITIASLRVKDAPIISLNQGWTWLAIVAFMVAGLAGGIIASTISQRYGNESKSAAAFLTERMGPSGFRCLEFTARTWTIIEHYAFWIGLVFAVLSFSCGKELPVDPRLYAVPVKSRSCLGPTRERVVVELDRVLDMLGGRAISAKWKCLGRDTAMVSSLVSRYSERTAQDQYLQKQTTRVTKDCRE